MSKFFRLVGEVKLYCDAKGALLRSDEGDLVEVPAEDTEAEEVQVEDEAEVVAEVGKMLKKATAEAKSDAEKSLGESAKAATEAVNDMFKAITEGAKKNTKTFAAADLKASFDTDTVKKGIEALSNKQRNSFSFSIKSLKDLAVLERVFSEGDSLTGDVIEGQRVPEITRDPVRQPFMEQIVDVTPNMTSDHLSYVECVNESGAPLPTAELAEIQPKDFEFQEFKAYLKKIAVINKHSVEILKDGAQLVNAIKGWLQEDVNIATDDQILNGTGVGDELPGVLSLASVLDATAVGTKRVESANLADVIRVAVTKIAVAGKGNFVATYVVLNPEDADELDLTKDENGQYVLPPFRSADGTTIKGARIIENVGIPAGSFLVGDFRRYHLGTQGGVEIEMTNSDGDDFKHDILTVKLRRRVAAYARQNDNGAFWTGDIEDVKGYLTAS